GVTPQAYGVLAAGGQADETGHVAQELVGVKIAAEPVEVGLVLAQRRDAGPDRGGGVDEMGGVATGGYVDRLDPVPGRARVGEQPRVAGVPAGVDRSQADRPVVGVVDRSLL